CSRSDRRRGPPLPPARLSWAWRKSRSNTRRALPGRYGGLHRSCRRGLVAPPLPRIGRGGWGG
ncbi:MAG: hypothetical protein AVDCRST_MAG59-4351, partial [uncultured Thermomicrobiales bacterium]